MTDINKTSIKGNISRVRTGDSDKFTKTINFDNAKIGKGSIVTTEKDGVLTSIFSKTKDGITTVEETIMKDGKTTSDIKKTNKKKPRSNDFKFRKGNSTYKVGK